MVAGGISTYRDDVGVVDQLIRDSMGDNTIIIPVLCGKFLITITEPVLNKDNNQPFLVENLSFIETNGIKEKFECE